MVLSGLDHSSAFPAAGTLLWRPGVFAILLQVEVMPEPPHPQNLDGIAVVLGLWNDPAREAWTFWRGSPPSRASWWMKWLRTGSGRARLKLLAPSGC